MPEETEGILKQSSPVALDEHVASRGGPDAGICGIDKIIIIRQICAKVF